MSSGYRFSTGLKVSAEISAPVTFTVPAGATGSSVEPAELGGNYQAVLVKCDDCAGIAATTSMTAQVGFAGSDAVCDLYEQDNPSTKWSKGALPESGTLVFLLAHAAGARRVRLILSKAVTADVVFSIIGLRRLV